MTFKAFRKQSKPHALDKAVTASGLFPSTPQTVSYTGFDKVGKVRMGNDSLVYTYGYGHQRIAMEEHVGNTVRTKRYVGACERVTETMGSLTTDRWLTYLTGPTGVYAVVVTMNGTNTLHYILKDNLGSWTTITDSDGVVEQRLSYDAWGNLRDPNTWSGSFTGTPMFDRGFTGHEHLTSFGLINMNGRMYDPMMSSFLSVDRYIQDPTSAQGFNRYAYCLYNPLRYVDPTGWYVGAPVSRSGLIRDYLSDPCYITRQQLREAGMYDIEGGYSWSGGHGSMNTGWMEADGQLHTSEWGLTTSSGGFEAGAWAIPASFNAMWINYCLGYCDYGYSDYHYYDAPANTGNYLVCINSVGKGGGRKQSGNINQFLVNKIGCLPLDVDNIRGYATKQLANYKMLYNVSISKSHQLEEDRLSVKLSGLSSNSMVVGDVTASAKATIIVEGLVVDSKPFTIDPLLSFLNPENTTYIGNALFVIPTTDTVTIKIKGGWNVYSGSGWMTPYVPILGTPINADLTIQIITDNSKQ